MCYHVCTYTRNVLIVACGGGCAGGGQKGALSTAGSQGHVVQDDGFELVVQCIHLRKVLFVMIYTYLYVGFSRCVHTGVYCRSVVSV